MYVIEVIPLQRGVQMDSLSYFSSEQYSLGNLVTIPVRNRDLRGIVTSIEEASATKTALRAATFSLRRLPHQEKVETLSPAFIKTAEELSDHYASSTGAVLYSLLAPEIQRGEIPLPHTHHVSPKETHLPEVLIANRKERYLSYRSLVREIFVHSGSVLFVVPTSTEAHEMYNVLSPGIEDRIIILTSSISKKQLKESYAVLEDFSKPKLIIATPSHAMVERHDITTTIIEHSRSQHLKELTRPYLDYRDVVRIHSKHTGRRCIFADLLVRSEEEHARRTEVYGTVGETPRRIELKGKLEIVNMKDKPDGSTPFRLFSPHVIEAILKMKKEKGHAFLFTPRRGLAPVVACIDCGFIFRSPQSGAPYSLVRIRKNNTEERWFVCSTSGHRERAADICTACGSWRLRERGIGIQHVHDELSKLIGNAPIILFDYTTAKTYKKACFLRDKFENTKGGIMLGTSMAIPYLRNPVDLSVVVNMDALYATPTWRLQEENLALLLRLREETSGIVYVQTRMQNDSLLDEARHGNIEHFYTEELELRKTFNYPPFTTFIHLTWQGKKEITLPIETMLEEALKGYSVSFYTAPPTPKDIRIHYGLIRLSSKDWPDIKLRDILRKLPPTIRIVINPDRIV